MTVHMTFNDTEEYSLRSIAILGCNICSQITAAHETLPKTVLSTVKIFAVQKKSRKGRYKAKNWEKGEKVVPGATVHFVRQLKEINEVI